VVIASSWLGSPGDRMTAARIDSAAQKKLQLATANDLA
jgi:hypothetical protein